MTRPSLDERFDALPNLDLLRALAVGLVLLDHVFETIAARGTVTVHPYDWSLGRAGVLLFFVHTTYVLLSSLSRTTLTGWDRIRDFYVRRVFRIYPLSAFFVLLVVVARIPLDPWAEYEWQGWGNLLSNLALTTNLTHDAHVLSPLWTLPYEVQMYAVLPFVFLFVGGKHWMRVIILLCMAVAVETVFLAVQLDTVFDYLEPYFAPCFMGGAVAYVMSQRRRWCCLPAGLWLPFLVVAVTAYLLIDAVTPGLHTVVLQWGFALLIGVAVPLFGQLEFSIFVRFAGVVAKYSYGIYMSHCVALWLGLYVCAWASVPLQWIISAVTLVALSFASYQYIERPGILFGRRLAARLRSARATAAAARAAA